MKNLKKQLWFQVMVAMILGLAAGLLLAPSGGGLFSEEAVNEATPWMGQHSIKSRLPFS